MELSELSISLAHQLQGEVMCPVCLDYLKDPMTLICGHNFCGSCIKMSWQDLQDMFPCPLCRMSLPEKFISENLQLGRLVDLVKILKDAKSMAMTQEEAGRCAEHQQELSLFCEDHEELLCPLCAQGPAHQGHHTTPVAEAANHHRQRLISYIEPLKKQMEEVQKLLALQDKNLLHMKEDMTKHRIKLVSEFEQLNRFVQHEQEVALSTLVEEGKHLKRQLNTRNAAYSQYFDTIRGLIKELVERSVMSEVMLLRQLKGIEQLCKDPEPPDVQPPTFSWINYSLPPLCSALSNLIRRFLEPVSLDPQMAHPSLRVSEDGKSVSWVPGSPKAQARGQAQGSSAELVVLGRESFACGRHYWEVQVGDKPEWAVGVCTDAPCNQAQGFPPGRKGLWVLQLQDGVYLGAGSALAPLALKDRPKVIGIFLDYELGQLCFYNASDRSYLHSFSENFVEVLKPYFRVGPDCTPLTLNSGTGEQE
ncbi:tripartite motif-containing protein 75-like [Suncus etruscus]|uniref:tripartite motif-containing protein 75-like n=1 Tax=Suncus etruscus TaxID=109475 RepID=UPI00210FD334|nr:tripartite motif-containing protein 75-like [Suncus etruscus]